jgi:uncharacterized protein YndB with AHSA1/START domain
MQKLHFTIEINAPKEKAWHAMLDDQTYREWTSAFMPGSYYEGAWETGSKMRFLAPDPDGTVSGMFSEIKEVRPMEFVSIKNLGEIKKGAEFPFLDQLENGQEWLENYTFIDKGEKTEIQVDIDSNDEFAKMFSDMWPKALQSLKEVAERN